MTTVFWLPSPITLLYGAYALAPVLHVMNGVERLVPSIAPTEVIHRPE